MERGVSGKRFCGSASSGASCCPRLLGSFEHLMQPGHRPGEKLSPREGHDLLEVTPPASGKAGRRARAPGPLSAPPARWLGKWLCVLGPDCGSRLAGSGHRLGGASRPGCWWLFIRGDNLWDFSARALGLWVQLWAPKTRRERDFSGLFLSDIALQLRCVSGVGARA